MGHGPLKGHCCPADSFGERPSRGEGAFFGQANGERETLDLEQCLSTAPAEQLPRKGALAAFTPPATVPAPPGITPGRFHLLQVVTERQCVEGWPVTNPNRLS